MSAVLAGKFIIFITVVLLGLNIHQLWYRYQSIVNQLQEFRDTVQEEGVSENALNIMNVVFYIVTPIFFSLLIYWAGMSFWVIGAMVAKFAAGGVLSYWLQKNFLNTGNLSLSFFYVIKVDSVVNLVMLSGLLWILFV